MRLPKNFLIQQLIDKLVKHFLTLWDNHLLILMTIYLNIPRKYFLIFNIIYLFIVLFYDTFKFRIEMSSQKPFQF